MNEFADATRARTCSLTELSTGAYAAPLDPPPHPASSTTSANRIAWTIYPSLVRPEGRPGTAGQAGLPGHCDSHT